MNRIILIGFVYFFLTALVTSCSVVAPPAPSVQIPWKNRQASLEKIQNWQLNGKIAVVTAKNSGSATVDWQQNGGNYKISLLGPLGSNGLRLSGQPGHVTMQTADGKNYSAASPEQLLIKTWGWNLPVSNLHYWVRGLSVPGKPSSTHFDDFGRLTELSQEGYDVQFLSYTKSGDVDLPSKIFITSPAVKVKLIVYEWKVG